MAFLNTHTKHRRINPSQATTHTMPKQRKRPSIVDGKVLEPEWNLEPQTYGSFTQDTLDRVAQARAEEASMASVTSKFSHSQKSPPHHPHRQYSMEWQAKMQPSASKDQPRKRYYSSNLSDKDRTALAVGEHNHNLREWKDDDLVKYHMSRIEMVPYTKNRQEVIAVILDEMRGSERPVLKSAQQTKQFVGLPLTRLELISELETNKVQTNKEACQSVVAYRAVSTPSLHSAPTSLSPQKLPSSFPSSKPELQGSHQSMNDLGNTSGYFDMQSSCGSMDQSPCSSESSLNSGRNRVSRMPDRRPLVQKKDRPSRARRDFASESHLYVTKADVTFDNFLAPHASGKGETYRDFLHIEKEEPRSFHRRFKKMASMPQLKKRAS